MQDLVADIPRPRSRLFEGAVAIGLSVVVGTGIVLMGDLRTLYQSAVLAGLVGLAALASIPNRRMALVVGWVLVHPLSIEKVFFVGQPVMRDFFPPTIVMSASDIFLVLLVASLIHESIVQQRKAWCWPACGTPYALLIVWMGILLLRQPSTEGVLAVARDTKMLVFMVALFSAVRTRDDFLLLLAAILVAVGIQAVVVGVSYVMAKPIVVASTKAAQGLLTFSGAEGSLYHRATGTLGHVNQQAVFHTFFTLPLLGLAWARNRVWQAVSTVIIAVSFLAIVLTFSRSAWLAFPVGGAAVVILALKVKQINRRVWVVVWSGIVFLAVVFTIYNRPILDRLLVGDEGATASRKRAADLALDLAAMHPVEGVGPGRFVNASLEAFPPDAHETEWRTAGEREMPERLGRLEYTQVKVDEQPMLVPLPVHNKYLLVLSELGGIGLLFFVWFQWRVFKHALRAARAHDRVLLWAGLGIFGAFFATQVYMMLDLFADDKTMELLLIVPVLAMIADRITGHELRAERTPS
jgi:O-antigen ligase